MNSCISAIGTANPPFRIPQENIYQFMVKAFGLNEQDASRLNKIYAHSDIAFRHSAIPDFGLNDFEQNHFFSTSQSLEPFPDTKQRMQFYKKNAIKIATEAVQKCLANFDASFTGQISHLITVSCTGMYAPGIDIDLIETIGLQRNIERTCINFMGCYGAINALKVADYICRADANAKVLVVSVELCTLHFQKENTLENWISNSLFADGAAAVLVENTDKRSITNPYLQLKNFYTEYIHETQSDMSWHIGNFGFDMTLSSKVSKQIQKYIGQLTAKVLEKSALNFTEINAFAVHPGGKKILEAVENGLNICTCKNSYAHEVLRDYGNMSSATILFVLQKILNAKTENQTENILSFAFGPGLTVESLVLQKQSV